MKAKWLDRGLVLAPFYITLASDERLYRKILKSLKIETDWDFLEPGKDARMLIFENKAEAKSVAILTVRRGKWTAPQLAGIFAHESMHLWRQIREDIGETSPSSEFEAYAIQNLAQGFYEEYLRQVKRKKS